MLKKPRVSAADRINRRDNQQGRYSDTETYAKEALRLAPEDFGPSAPCQRRSNIRPKGGAKNFEATADSDIARLPIVTVGILSRIHARTLPQCLRSRAKFRLRSDTPHQSIKAPGLAPLIRVVQHEPLASPGIALTHGLIWLLLIIAFADQGTLDVDDEDTCLPFEGKHRQ